MFSGTEGTENGLRVDDVSDLLKDALLCDTHVVGYVGVSSVTEVLVHHRQVVLRGRCQKQLLVHCLQLEGT